VRRRKLIVLLLVLTLGTGLGLLVGWFTLPVPYGDCASLDGSCYGVEVFGQHLGPVTALVATGMLGTVGTVVTWLVARRIVRMIPRRILIAIGSIVLATAVGAIGAFVTIRSSEFWGVCGSDGACSPPRARFLALDLTETQLVMAWSVLGSIIGVSVGMIAARMASRHDHPPAFPSPG
jgi:hypothetical protein